MSLRIHTLPADEAVLRAPATPAPAEAAAIREHLGPDLTGAMAELMYAQNGVGLAAQQAGVEWRVCLIDPDVSGNWTLFVNPQIVERSKDTVWAPEGCLSIPGRQGNVERAEWVEVLSLDGDAEPVVQRFEGWAARVVQHELDHLDGTLICDKWDPPGL